MRYPIDANAAARAALSGHASVIPKDDTISGIRAPRNAARPAVKARTATLNQITHILTTPVGVPDISDLRPARQARNITLTTVAEHFSVWPAVISRTERGTRRADDLAGAYRGRLTAARPRQPDNATVPGRDVVDDEVMLVRTESLPQAPRQHTTVRVHTPIGSAVVLWHGELREADGRHLIEWTVDADLHWARNTRPAAATEPELRQEGDRVIMRGRLHLTDDEAAYLQMGHWSVLFDLASPIPSNMDGSWVEISVGTECVALHPYRT